MSCHHPSSPTGVAALTLRVTFGVSLLLVGIVHYMTFEPFAAMTADGLGPLESLGSLWALLLPALQILGGALLASGKYTLIGSWAAGVALGSIAIGMLLKPVLSGTSLPDVMSMVNNTFIWLLVYFLVIKTSCCSSEK